jgi:hypothetical protein
MASEQQLLFEAAIANSPPYPADRFADRGIVICAGGARLFTCAWVAIGILRRVLGCRLPIEVWHLGSVEMGPPMRALLEGWDVEVVDALQLAERYPVRILGGWELKPYAIVHSRFREVFLLDADNVALIDPASLFELPEYAATGAIFWPDIVRLRADNPIWEVCGVAYRSTPSFESGQLLVDKQRCWQALQLTLHMNQHSDFFYQHLYGDKDTFLMAWLRLGQNFAMTAHPPLFRHGVLNQRDFHGRTIFQHRNGAKWSYGSGNPQIPDFELEAECFDLLTELREVWNGRVFNPPDMSAPAHGVAASLQKIEWFDYLQTGSVEKKLQLLPANRIGAGRGENEFYWWVEEDAQGMVLALEGRRRLACRLRPALDGSWVGRSLELEAWETHLTPRRSPIQAGDPMVASAAALLDAILASPAGRPRDDAMARDLMSTLRILRAAVPGFAAALGNRVPPAGAPARADDETIRCLRAVLAEPTAAQPEHWPTGADQGSRSRTSNLGSRYETNR